MTVLIPSSCNSAKACSPSGRPPEMTLPCSRIAFGKCFTASRSGCTGSGSSAIDTDCCCRAIGVAGRVGLLPVLEPMGMQLAYKAGEGPVFANPLRSTDDVARLTVVPAAEGTPYIAQTVRQILDDLPASAALICHGATVLTRLAPMLPMATGVPGMPASKVRDEPLLSQLSAGIPVETYVQVFAENKPTSVYTLSLLYRRDIELTYSAVGREIDSKNKILVLSIEVPLGQEWSEWDLSQVDFDASELEVGEIHRKSETEWEIELSEKKELDRPYVGFIYFKNSDSPPIKRAITVTSRVETRLQAF